MNSEMTTDSQLSTNTPTDNQTNKPQKQILRKQLEEEQNQRNGHHMESFQWGRGGEEWGRELQGIRSIIGRQKWMGRS